MNYENAQKVHNIIEKLKQINKDIQIFEDAIKSGIVGAQVTIQCKEGTFNSTIYENNRIDLLLKVLYEEKSKLTAEIEGL